MGNITSLNQIFGKNPIMTCRNAAVSTGLEILTETSADCSQYTIMDRETTVSISSTDAKDASAGVGAQTVKIEGYGRTMTAVSETVSMNGQTAVVTTATYMIVTKITPMTFGSDATNDGILYVIRAGESTLTTGTPNTKLAIMGVLAATTPAGGTAGFVGVSSSSATDSASTGALTLTIYGMDHYFRPQEETVTLTGQTMVKTTKRFRRIMCAEVATAGTGRTNAGDIYVYFADHCVLSSGVPAALTAVPIKILVGNSIAQSGLWTVPLNTQYKFNKIRIGCTAAAADLYLQVRFLTQGAPASSYATEILQTFNPINMFTQGPQEFDLSQWKAIAGAADIELRALSASSSVVSAQLFLNKTSGSVTY